MWSHINVDGTPSAPTGWREWMSRSTPSNLLQSEGTSMDTFTAELLAGLITESVFAVAGPVARHFGKDKIKLKDSLSKPITVAAEDVLVRSINQLEKAGVSAPQIDKALSWLKSPEGAAVRRGITIAVLTADEQELESDFNAQIEAYLRLFAAIPEAPAKQIASTLRNIVVRVVLVTRDSVKATSSPEVLAQIIERAAA